MTTGIVIPAHMGSTRFPGKPLALVGGKPLLSYAVDAARASGLPWCVATSDHEIAEWFISTYCIEKNRRIVFPPLATNGGFVLTPECRNGTERAAHANSKLKWDRVIVLQCDEPDVTGEDIKTLLKYESPATVAAEMQDSDLGNPNAVCISVAESIDGCLGDNVALRFTRSATDEWGIAKKCRHIGVYLYDATMLDEYMKHPQSPYEEAQSLEQLRTMAMGYVWEVSILDRHLRSVNVPADVEKFL